MSLRTKLSLSRESELLEGEPAEVDAKLRAAHAEALRSGRLAAARRNSRWREVEETALVARQQWFVEADSDVVLQPVRGEVFDSASAVAIADMSELWFTVSANGHLRFYERVPGISSWTAYLEEQAARERQRNAPKPRPAWMDP